MNRWTAIFRAELLRFSAMLPWILLVHGLRVFFHGRVITGWPPLVEWVAWVLAAWVLVAVVWRDAPLRRERYLAVRPLPLSSLFAGKFAALLVLVVLPFSAVEGIDLLRQSLSMGVVAAGMAQTALLMIPLVLAGFAVAWLWEKSRSGVIALVAALVGIELGWWAWCGARWFNGREWRMAHGHLADPRYLAFTFAAIAGLCGVIFLVHRRRSLPRLARIGLFLVAVCASSMGAAWMASRNFSATEPTGLPLVHLTLTNNDSGSGIVNWLGIEPASPALAPDEDVIWSFRSLRMNGRAVPMWPDEDPGERLKLSNYSTSFTPPVWHALARHLGHDPEVSLLRNPTTYPASIALPGKSDPERTLDLEATLLGTVVRWEVVADLDLKSGEAVRNRDSLWRIVTGAPEARISLEDQTRRFVLERSLRFWLAGQSEPGNPRSDRWFLANPGEGWILPADTFQLPESRAITSALRWQRNQPRFSNSSSTRAEGEEEKAKAPPTRALIVRAIPVRRVTVDWKTVKPLSCKGLWSPAPQRSGQDKPGGDPVAWLKDHPAPGENATDREVAGWLEALLDEMGDRMLSGDQRKLVIEAIGSQVPKHLPVVEAGMYKAYARGGSGGATFYLAILGNLTREGLHSCPDLVRDGFFASEVVSRGWARDFAALAAEETRNGLGWQVKDVLLAEPEAAGLSESEWLAFFRIYPSAGSYAALRGKVLKAEEIDAEADRLLDTHVLLPFEWEDRDSLLELSFARGRADAPVGLSQGIKRVTRVRQISSFNVGKLVRAYFVLPDDIVPKDGRQELDWFLAQDPARFVFDPATRKFHLP